MSHRHASTPTPTRLTQSNLMATNGSTGPTTPKMVGTPNRLRPIPSPNDRRQPPPISFAGHSPGGAAGAAKRGVMNLGDLDSFHARLRKDVLLMQATLEAAGRRNPLSFEARKVEAELLRSTHEPTAEERMAALLRIVERKVQEISAAASSDATDTVGDAPGPASSSSPSQPSQHQQVKPLIAPLVEALLRGESLPSIAGGVESSAAASSSAAEVPSAATAAVQGGLGHDHAAAATTGPGQAASSPPPHFAVSMLSEGSLAALADAGVQLPQTATADDLVRSVLEAASRRGSVVAGGGGAASMMGPSSLSGSVQPPETAASPLLKSAEKKASIAAGTRSPAAPSPIRRIGGHGSPSASFSASPTTASAPAAVAVGSTEGLALHHQQALMEIDALRGRLAAKEREVSDMRHQLSSSRYAFNAPRTLTTVHDAPMSFEVERQYQKELHRLAERVKELEADYGALHVAGAGDRDRVGQLTAEAAQLRQQMEADRAAMAALQSERDEQAALFGGVSRARGEEARMSLVAVKQLESRVADLEEKLRRKTDECRFLLSNAETLWDMWHAADSELTKVASELGETKDRFEGYSLVYDEHMATQLEEALVEVHRLGRQCDEQTALTTIQKQRLDDAEMLRALTVHEQQLWMERLKGSTEWKMLNVKSPDETKQLAVRIMMLTGEKEKKESTMTASHTERLSLFKARADREVSDRCERRETAMPIVDAASAAARWHSDEDAIMTRFGAERAQQAMAGQGGRTTKLRYADVKSAFLEELPRRKVDFRVFFNDEVEARAAQEVGGGSPGNPGTAASGSKPSPAAALGASSKP